jgi:hypothetical protein
MMKLILFVLFCIFITPKVYAVAGVGDLVYDPSMNSQMATMISQAKQMYESAKLQLDKMVSMEKTIREAQEAYETLSKYDINEVAKKLQNGGKLNSFAALRGQIANTEGAASQNSSFVSGNIERIRQLETRQLLPK